MTTVWSPRTQGIAALGWSTAASVGFYLYSAFHIRSFYTYDYLPWNLFLAWIPFCVTLWLVQLLKRRLWSSWPALGVSALWLLFLPNSFYMISDFVHLQEVDTSDVLYDAVMFTAFICTAVILGFASLYLVHQEFRKRMPARLASEWIATILLVCSFAIYIGRDLRWNSWDILTNPGGLLFDLSDQLLHPSNYAAMSMTVIAFFVLLITMYNLLWSAAQLLQAKPKR